MLNTLKLTGALIKPKKYIVKNSLENKKWNDHKNHSVFKSTSKLKHTNKKQNEKKQFY